MSANPSSKSVPGASTVRRLARAVLLTRRSRLLLFLILLCALGGNVLMLWAPKRTGQAIDLMSAGAGGLGRAALLLLAIYLGGSALNYLASAAAVGLANRTVYHLRQQAFENLGRLPLKLLDGRSQGELASRIVNDADLVGDGLNQLLTQLFSGCVTVAAALAFMLSMSVPLTLAVVVMTPLVFLVGRTVSHLTRQKFQEQQALVGELNGFIDEQYRGQRVVRAFHAEPQAQARFRRINAHLYTVGQKAQFYSSLTNPTTRFVNYLAYIAVGLVGGALAIRYGVSVGTVASFLTYSTLFSKPFNEFTALTSQLLSAVASAERLIEIIDLAPEPEDPPARALPVPRGLVEFEEVRFSYTPGRPLIEGLSLRVEPGSNVAIVGPTGAGKTTLINLLMRFYELDGGRILVDGVDIRQLPRDALRQQFGMVLQDAWLFEGTIHENIAYGRPGASAREVEQAARQAGAHSFIVRLPDGYQTRVDENGENLSQGQRQLITIARAMLLDPPMLILDEATSSVDTLTEQKIQRAFWKMMSTRTSFVIAHRLSTIQAADLILVMKDGRVVEQGSHCALLARGGLYAQLYRSQFEAQEL